MTKNLIEVTDAIFEQEVLKSELPVVVDFWAAWCGPCRSAAPVVEDLASAYDGKVRFAKLNIDANRATAQAHMVMSIPSFLVFKNGKEIGRLVGFRPKPKFKDEIDQLLK